MDQPCCAVIWYLLWLVFHSCSQGSCLSSRHNIHAQGKKKGEGQCQLWAWQSHLSESTNFASRLADLSLHPIGWTVSHDHSNIQGTLGRCGFYSLSSGGRWGREIGNEHRLISQPAWPATVRELYERVPIPRVSRLILFKIPLEVRKGFPNADIQEYAWTWPSNSHILPDICGASTRRSRSGQGADFPLFGSFLLFLIISNI